jgi:hypothetical protein
MTRNQEIQKIFETADDSLQAVLGYHFYVMALYNSVDDLKKIRTHLPNVSHKEGVDAFPHTFSWLRYYYRDELIATYMPPFFELYQSRVSLTAIVSVFDDTLDNFVIKLKHLGCHPRLDGKEFEPKKKWFYKQRIEWAFSESREATIGDLEAIKRLPKTFGIIDEARRLRNVIMHNHGIFDERYDDAIKSKDIERVEHPGYARFRDSGKDVAVVINYADIVNFSRAHIEILHIIHNQIQKKYFNHPEPYHYGREKKIIRWDSAFWGNAELENVKQPVSRESYLNI